MAAPENDPFREFKAALKKDDVATVRELSRRYPELTKQINEPSGCFGALAICGARSPEMLDALIEAGADLNAKSDWWAGGFGLLHTVPPELAAHAIKRGAKVDVHAAARLGLLDQLAALIEQDSSLVDACGGDGQTP